LGNRILGVSIDLLKAIASKLTEYMLDPVAVQEVTWDKINNELADYNTFSYGNGNADHHLGQASCYLRGSDRQVSG